MAKIKRKGCHEIARAERAGRMFVVTSWPGGLYRILEYRLRGVAHGEAPGGGLHELAVGMERETLRVFILQHGARLLPPGWPPGRWSEFPHLCACGWCGWCEVRKLCADTPEVTA